jgi:F0F1-type ATP synthase assembly protein I
MAYDDKIVASKPSLMTDDPQSAKPSEKPKNIWKQYGEYSQIALILPASVVAGVILGAALDKWLHTSWLTLAGLLLGAVAGFIQLGRWLMRASKES